MNENEKSIFERILTNRPFHILQSIFIAMQTLNCMFAKRIHNERWRGFVCRVERGTHNEKIKRTANKKHRIKHINLCKNRQSK